MIDHPGPVSERARIQVGFPDLADDRWRRASVFASLVAIPPAVFFLIDPLIPRPAAVALSLFVIPAAGLHAMGEPLVRRRGIGPFLLGVAAYGLILAYSLPYLLHDPRTFGPVPAASLVWGTATLFAWVAPVDFFVRRVIQDTAESLWGVGWAMVGAYTAWVVGHYHEYSHLLFPRLGPVRGLLFLAFTGFVTTVAYVKSRNVAGLMVGHVLLNLGLAAASWLLGS